MSTDMYFRVEATMAVHFVGHLYFRLRGTGTLKNEIESNYCYMHSHLLS